MLDPFPIVPFTQPASASVRLPGSKSITNRALLLSALSKGETLLNGALFSEDTDIMVESLRRLGFNVSTNRSTRTIRVRGEGGRIPNRQAKLFIGNAGTAARFLTAFCCLAPEGTYEIDGVPAMRKRPMKGLIDALNSLGANIESDGGFFPIKIRSGGLAGGSIEVDAASSSQMLSALLMVAPMARNDCTFSFDNVRLPFVSMTLGTMVQFGQDGKLLDQAGPGIKQVTVNAGTPYLPPKPGTYQIEADVTAASYFATLPLVTGGQITIENLSRDEQSLQGDSAYFAVLKKIGCRITSAQGGGSRFDFPGPMTTAPLDEDFSRFSDTFLTLAAVSPLLMAPIHIRGIAHTRRQETDRVAGMAIELRKLGQEISEREDSLAITPSPEALQDIRGEHLVETYKDHRFAMGFALLGLRDLRHNGKAWIAIRDPGCCAKTFPDYFETLERVRQSSHGASVG